VSAEKARAALVNAELARDWQMVRVHLERASSVSPDRGLPEAALVALSLDHAYQAFESFLVRLERSLELPVRVGSSWHRDALTDATLDLPGIRPAIVPSEATRDWSELLRFRHFLRHAYTVELDADKLAANTERLRRAVGACEPNVQAILTALLPAER
jgi:hypothetical protein